MSQLSESITLEQLADHNTLESLWIAIHGHVYDLTTFSSDHPGGIEALESCAGTDGTESYEYAGHSKSNMAKMQQYRVGTLAGSLKQASPISYNRLPVESKRIRSATSRLKQLRFPRWTKRAVTLSAISLVAALSYQRRDSLVDYISPALNISQLQFRAISDQNTGHAFWAGIAIASSISCVGFSYLYKLFLSTLDYQNELFNLPATIPRKAKR
ncbi:cytochrome b5-like heme/steroid binding domain-containing protein [Phaeosphaeriaceae sp. PMI808]|nr:cytochrome b5-like heme/steroid binding domain-containing protein [Phaeosphaeriaceae sp. PMI808]